MSAESTAPIIKSLQEIHARWGYLPRAALAELATLLDVPQHRVQEIASCFPMFRPAWPDRPDAGVPHLHAEVCCDLSCHLRGAATIYQDLRTQLASQPDCVVGKVSCLGRCVCAPVVRLNGDNYMGRGTKPEEHSKYFQELIAKAQSEGKLPPVELDALHKRTQPQWRIDPYPADASGREYSAVKRFVKEYPTHDDVLKTLIAAAEMERQKADAEKAKAEAEAGAPLAQKAAEAVAMSLAMVLEAQRERERESQAVRSTQERFEESLRNLKEEQSKNVFSAISVLGELRAANLFGMGGAGAPAFKKWCDVLSAPGGDEGDYAKYIVCNADESEPATFKDRELLLRTPHLIVEGMILAGLVTNATRGFIYIRHEYEEQAQRLRDEIQRAESLRVCGRKILKSARSFELEVFVSPGGYICGEQSALLEALEDRRAEPRPRPPEIGIQGLFGKPTLVNNVETLAWTPYIYLKGGKAYQQDSRGLRFFSISGDVREPGVYEVEVRQTLGELIALAGGVRGKGLKAVAASGPSGGFLPAMIPVRKLKDDLRAKLEGFRAVAGTRDKPVIDLLRMPLDFDLFRGLGLMLGAGMVVYAEGRDIIGQAMNALEFFHRESCGKCVPCRLGTEQLVQIGGRIVKREPGTADWLKATAKERDGLMGAMLDGSICGLGGVAYEPLKTLLNYFGPDIDRHLDAEARV